MSLFGPALAPSGKPLSDTNWIDALKAMSQTIDAGLLRAKGIRSTDKTLTTAVPAYFDFSGLEYDTGGSSWAGGNPTRLYIPQNGLYRVSASARFAANATGIRQMGLWKNHAVEIQTITKINDGGSIVTVVHYCEDLTLSASDYLELLLLQTSGGNLAAQTPFCTLSYCKLG